MASYAILTNGTVSNVVDADPTFAASKLPGAIRIDTLSPIPGIGWTYANGAFNAPVTQTQTPPPTPAPSPIFRRTDFMRLFTDAEIQGILTYDSNTNLSAAQKLAVMEFVEYFRDADMVDVTNPTTSAGLNLLASVGLLTSPRAAQILASHT